MKIEQWQYFGEGQLKSLNNPSDLNINSLTNGIEFEDLECRGVQISTIPGIKIQINDQDITIGETGKYILPVEEKVKIRNLKVDLESLNFINQNLGSFITITFILD